METIGFSSFEAFGTVLEVTTQGFGSLVSETEVVISALFFSTIPSAF